MDNGTSKRTPGEMRDAQVRQCQTAETHPKRRAELLIEQDFDSEIEDVEDWPLEEAGNLGFKWSAVGSRRLSHGQLKSSKKGSERNVIKHVPTKLVANSCIAGTPQIVISKHSYDILWILWCCLSSV